MSDSMWANAWLYRCRTCQRQHTLPGMDMAWQYGKVLAVSPNARAVVVDVLSDPAYRDIAARTAQHPNGPADPLKRAALTRQVASELLDPDPDGAPYSLNDPLPCPACTGPLDLQSSTTTRHSQVPAATWHAYEDLSDQARQSTVSAALARLLQR